MIRRTCRPIGAVVLAVALVSAARPVAAAVFNTTMDTLITGGSNAGGISLGDKRYSNFTFSSSGSGGATPIAATAVDVSLTSSDSDNHYQLRFTFARDQLDASAAQTTDVVITYQIDVLGSQLINRVGLAFDGTVTGGNGNAAASVIETIRTSDGSDLEPGLPVSDNATISVFNDGTGAGTDTSSTSLAVNPTSSLQFTKDILVSSREGGGRVLITTVDNFVDQVPEPASAAVIGVGAGLLLARRRRT